MNAKVLLFPIAAAAVVALDACAGLSPTDPSIRLCHDDTLEVVVTFPGNRVAYDTMVVHDDTRYCRKAA